MKHNPAAIGNSRFSQGLFIPQNPKKCIGDLSKFIYRSSWEKDFMNTCDLNPAIMQWGSETISIPYMHPVTGTQKQYFPDFFISYMASNGAIIHECIEIKPAKESLIEKARSKRDKIQIAVNQAKWAAANIFCNANGFKFRVLTEAQMYGKGK